MSAQKTEKVFLAKLTLKKISDASTLEITVSDRNYPAGYLYSGSPEVQALLTSINGFGQEMGEVVTKSGDGTIELVATRNSYAASKRIYDLFEDYIIINQAITCQSFQKEREKLGDIADLVTEFVGEVVNYKIENRNQTLMLYVRTKNFSNDLVNKRYSNLETSAGLFNNYRLLLKNKNTFSPLVFGNQNLMPITQILVNNELSNPSNPNPTDYNIVYGVASRLGDYSNRLSDEPFPIPADGFGTANYELYLKNPQNEYEQISFEKQIDIFTGFNAILGLNWNAAVNGGMSFTDGTNTYYFYVPLLFTEANKKILCSAFAFELKGRNNGALPCEGEIIFDFVEAQIDEVNNLDPVYTAIQGARFVINKESVASLIKGNNDTVLFAGVDRPFILDSNKKYYMRIEETGAPVTPEALIRLVTSTKEIFIQQKNNFDGKRYTTGVDSRGLKNFRAFGYSNYDLAFVNPAVKNSNFFTFNIDPLKRFLSTNFNFQKFAPATIFDFVLNVDGYIDKDGTIIGALETFERGFDILKLLYYLQNEQSLTGWNTTRFTGADALSENIAGVETAGIGYRNLMLHIAEADSAALIINRDGTVSYWTYGVTQSIAATISERDCILEDIENTGLESVVNKITLSYGQKLLPLSGSEIDTESFDNLITESRADSIAVYGSREPSDAFLKTKWIKDLATAEKYIGAKLDQYEFEKFIFTIRVPYWLKNFKDLELWDLVDLNHIDLPSKYGSQPPNQTKNLFDGVDWAIGDSLRHAQNYICRIISRVVLYDLDSEPEIVFKLRAINKNEIAL